MPHTVVEKAAVRVLTRFWRRSAYRRQPRPERFDEGSRRYKKGWELRFVVKNELELQRVVDALGALGIAPGKPFQKARQIVLPVYGRDVTEGLVARLAPAA